MSCAPLEITELALMGSTEAVDRIARCYMSHLLLVGACTCKRAADVPDAVQEALLAATERLSQFRGQGSVKSWVSAMVVNACRCQSRGRKHDPAWNRPLAEGAGVAADTEDPRTSLAAQQAIDAIGLSLRQLPAKDQELFLLSQLEELSARKLAKLTGRSPDAVRAQLARIRRKLRIALKSTWEEWRAPDGP